MTIKLDLFDIDQQLAIHAIESGNCEAWQCPAEVLDLADAIEDHVGEYEFNGGVVQGCWKPTVRRLTTPTGEEPGYWFEMVISLEVDSVTLDLRKPFGKAIEALRDQAQQLLDVAGYIEQLDPAREESEVVG